VSAGKDTRFSKESGVADAHFDSTSREKEILQIEWSFVGDYQLVDISIGGRAAKSRGGKVSQPITCRQG